jgi:hypothetical protein
MVIFGKINNGDCAAAVVTLISKKSERTTKPLFWSSDDDQHTVASVSWRVHQGLQNLSLASNLASGRVKTVAAQRRFVQRRDGAPMLHAPAFAQRLTRLSQEQMSRLCT